jgi:hypothetical protein
METGLFKTHFVRDIGFVYLVCGLSQAWFPLAATAAALRF